MNELIKIFYYLDLKRYIHFENSNDIHIKKIDFI